MHSKTNLLNTWSKKGQKIHPNPFLTHSPLLVITCKQGSYFEFWRDHTFLYLSEDTHLTHTQHWVFAHGLPISLQIWTHFKTYFHAIYDLLGRCLVESVSMGYLLIYSYTMYVIVCPFLHVTANAHTHPTTLTNQQIYKVRKHHISPWSKKIGMKSFQKCVSYFWGLL